MSVFQLCESAEGFAGCGPEGDVSTAVYLDVFRQVNTFLASLGSMFGFVTSEIEGKIKLLQKKLDEKPEIFATLKGAIEHEVAEGTTNTGKSKPSASRTLLRLNRAMESYNGTLSKHHGWMVRKTIGVAFMTLPNRQPLLKVWLGPDEDTWSLDPLVSLSANMQKVYDSCQELLTKHELLNIP